jgi:hypothetical protein
MQKTEAIDFPVMRLWQDIIGCDMSHCVIKLDFSCAMSFDDGFLTF